jgi:hypothetical protein
VVTSRVTRVKARETRAVTSETARVLPKQVDKTREDVTVTRRRVSPIQDHGAGTRIPVTAEVIVKRKTPGFKTQAFSLFLLLYFKR